ncbi:MAG: carboxylesterase family protein [Gemmataceae bacterium]
MELLSTDHEVARNTFGQPAWKLSLNAAEGELSESTNCKHKAGSSGGFLTLLLLAPALLIAQSPPVQTMSGLVAGMTLSHGIEVFKGIPFAAPPVGNLRWRPPQPPAAWQGVSQAHHFGPSCMQPTSPRRVEPWTRAFQSTLRRSENRLYLNVWTTAKRTARLRPVMV